MKTIEAVSEIKVASNKNTYVVLTLASAIEDGVLIEGGIKAFFADKALLNQIKVGMKMAA